MKVSEKVSLLDLIRLAFFNQKLVCLVFITALFINLQQAVSQGSTHLAIASVVLTSVFTLLIIYRHYFFMLHQDTFDLRISNHSEIYAIYR